MKKIALVVVVASMVFSTAVFAQPAQQAVPVGWQEWTALMKKQGEARKTLNEQLNAEREVFLKANPEVAARIEEQMKAAKERAAQRKSGMPAVPLIK